MLHDCRWASTLESWSGKFVWTSVPLKSSTGLIRPKRKPIPTWARSGKPGTVSSALYTSQSSRWGVLRSNGCACWNPGCMADLQVGSWQSKSVYPYSHRLLLCFKL